MTSHRSPIDLPSPLPWSLGRGVQTGGLWEVLGRSPEKTSRLETPINKGISKENGRSEVFSTMHLLFQAITSSFSPVSSTLGVYPI